MEPTHQKKLFIISGASGVGKSSACEILFRNESKYIVLESDIMWNDVYFEPETNYREYRERWLELSANISQIDLPVVLCGAAVPEQFESCRNREYFEEIVYIALVSDSNCLIERLKEGRGIENEDWIKIAVDFNEWLKENANSTVPSMYLIDNTNLSIEETAKEMESYILSQL